MFKPDCIMYTTTEFLKVYCTRLLATVAVARSPPPSSSRHSYLPQYDSSAFDVNATRSYRLVSSIRKYGLNSSVRTPKIVTAVVLLEPLRVNLHNTGCDKEELQFNRSRVPGITVVVSGVRVNSPSDPIKLNETNTI